MDKIDALRNAQGFAKAYSEFITLLKQYGFFDVLRDIHKIPMSLNDPLHVTAVKGAYRTGYLDAIDYILNFREWVIDPKKVEGKAPPMDFNSLERAKADGDLTAEEVAYLEEIRQ